VAEKRYDRPYPLPNPDMRPYWEAAGRGELLYQVCNACKEIVFHPRVICPYCLSDNLRYEKSAGKGKVYSFSVQYRAPTPAWDDKLPYALGIIEMDEGYFMFSEIVTSNLDGIKIGLPVEVFFDRVAPDLVLPKFRPTGDR
jgi:uncharacterized OB-fold protein